MWNATDRRGRVLGDINRTFLTWFIGVVFLLVANVALTFSNIRRLNEDAGWVTHTFEVMAGLEKTLSLAKGAETGQRGYIITGELRYLEPYNAAVAAIYAQVDDVERLTADNHSQSVRFPKLRERVSAKLKELDETIALRKNGDFASARQVVLTDRGKNEMDALQTIVAEMIHHERVLLRERAGRSEKTYLTSLATALLSGVVSVAAVVAFMVLLSRYLAERTHAARTLAEQGERLRTTLACIGDGVITTDCQGLITNLNGVAESLTGWANAEAMGLPLDTVFRIVNEETRQTVESPATRALREGVIVGLANHTVLIAKDGSELSIDDSAAPIRSKEGEILGSVMVFRDFTERRRAEDRLLTSEARQRLFIEHAPASIAMFDTEMRYLSVSNRWLSDYRVEGQEIIGKSHYEVFPDVPQHWRDVHQRGLRGEVISENESRFERPDGSVQLLRWEVRPWYSNDSEIGGIVVFTEDVSARKEAEERVADARRQLEESFAVLDTLLSTSPVGVAFVDTEFRFLRVNKMRADVSGLSVEEHIGRSVSDVSPLLWPMLEPLYQQALSGRGVVNCELTGEVASTPGQKRHWLVSYYPVSINDRMLGIGTVWVDVTVQKRTTEALQGADLRKTEFLATLAHELRNPLAPIRNALELMKMAVNETETTRRIREIMERQIMQMTRLIDDLMDVSRISQGKVQLERERVELAKIVQGAVETSQPLIAECGHKLTVTLPSGPVILDADSSRLAQVFLNLLNNAAKYTRRGGRIELRAEQQGSDLVVSVKDTGIGIPVDKLPTIFEMFSQVESALSRSQGGLGIGLSLAKRIVELHGGSIEAHSEGLDKGSEFVVRLPVVVEQTYMRKTDDHTDKATPTSDLRILVVDDNLDAASTLAMLLRFMGNDVRTAHDGEVAVQMAREWRPDVVLCDIGLPKLNGYDACRLMKEQSAEKNMILIALTGWGQDDDRRKAEAAGFDHHLTKPVKSQVLMQLLAELNAVKK